MHPNLEEEPEGLVAPQSNFDEDGHRKTYLLNKDDYVEGGDFVNSAFVNWFATFDEVTIRPFLIRNYTLAAV